MAFPKGKANPSAGRKPGVPNKMTVAVKEAIQLAFEGAGGVPALIEFAKSEKGKPIFYGQIYPKLLPLDIKHSGELVSKIVQVELPKKN